MTESAGAHADVRTAQKSGKRRQSKLAATSSFVGSTVEYYDFGLYGSASALIFGPVFFGPLGTVGATLAAFASFGVAYAARPLGAILFGWLGDRHGRRRSLLWALTLMGLSTVLIGLLPDYHAIGIAAPIILVLARVLQGLSAGGEQGGSNSLTLEHAPEGKRGLYASWTQQGATFGALLGFGAFFIVTSLPQDVLLSWAWRVPFLIAAPMMLVAFWIRRYVEEPEAFVEARSTDAVARVPLAEVFRYHWRSMIVVILATLTQISAPATTVFGLGYAATVGGMNPSTLLLIIMGASALGLIWVPMWARLSDRRGRKPVFIVVVIGAALAFIPYFWSLTTGNYALVAVTTTVLFFFTIGPAAIAQSFYTELFPTRVRFTGAAFSMQIGFVVAGFAPTIMTAIQGQGEWGWVPVAGFCFVAFLIAALAVTRARETSRVSLGALDD
jgi:MFS family permease